jgi:hypothetical protein
VDGAQYAYVQDIDEAGTKLVVYSYDYSIWPYSIMTSIFDLPGELLSYDAGPGHQLNAQNAYPNPSSDFILIPYDLPKGYVDGEIQVMDMQGKIIQSFRVDHQFDNLHINTAQYPKGTYLYRIIADGYQSEAKKLIIN